MTLAEWFTTYWLNPFLPGGVALGYPTVIALVWVYVFTLKRAMKKS